MILQLQTIIDWSLQVGSYLHLGSNCNDETSRWEFTDGKSIRQISSGLCWHPAGGNPGSQDGTGVHITDGCNQLRLQFTWEPGNLS